MKTFLFISIYSLSVLAFLSLVAGAFVFLGKFFTDNAEDPDAAAH
jgi:hypothetical protein